MSNLLDKASIVLTPTASNNGEALCVKPSDGSGDFDFSRNSAATRVNAQGLVENVQILSSNLVQNGDFSEEGAEEVSNGSFSQEGAELVTNGSFDTDTNWNKGTGWSIIGGTANCDGTNSFIFQNLSGTTTNDVFKVTYTISNYVSGNVAVGFGSGLNQPLGTQRNANGTYTEYLTKTSTSIAFGLKSFSFIGSIDNVSVKEVGQDWNLDTGWSIGDSEAIHTGAGSYIQQGSLTAGSNYKVVIDVTQASGSGFPQIYMGGLTTAMTSIDTYTFYITAQAGDTIKLRGVNDCKIGSISVKEVGQNWNFGGDWELVNGTAEIQSATTSYLSQVNVVDLSVKNYRLQYEVVTTNGSNFRITGGSSAFGTVILDSATIGVKTIDLTSNGTQHRLIFTQSAFRGSIDNISLIEITDDTNLPRINYEGFSYQDALGSELVVNGGFDTNLNNWVAYSNTLISWESGGYALLDSNNNFWCKIKQSNVFEIGKTYKVILTAKSDRTDLPFHNSPITGSFSEADTFETFEQYYTATTTDFLFGYANAGSATITIDNVSVKEYLGQEPIPNSGCGSWLFEPQSTNLVTQSEALSTMQNQSTITDNILTSPTGNVNASLVVENTATSSHGISKTTIIPTNPSATSYTISIFAKKKDRQYIQFSLYADSTSFTSSGFDLENGTTSGDANTHKIKDFGNGWYRCSFTENVTQSTGGYNFARVSIGTSLTSFYYAGDGASGLYMFGYQLEQNSFSTSYIPTEGTTVTRNQDVCNNGGSLASINSTEGVLYFEGSALVDGGSNRIISLSDETNDNLVQFRYDTTAGRITSFIRGNGGSYAIKTINGFPQANNNKVALVWNATNLRVWINGTESGSVSTNDLPIAMNTLSFTQPTGSANFFVKTKCLAVWKEALSDTELTSLTTI